MYVDLQDRDRQGAGIQARRQVGFLLEFLCYIFKQMQILTAEDEWRMTCSESIRSLLKMVE